MTAQSAERAAFLGALIARHSQASPHQIAAHVTHLQRIARQLQAIAERQCNGYKRQRYVAGTAGTPGARLEWVEDAPAREHDEAREKMLASRAGGIVSAWGTVFSVQPGGDPRGSCLRLLIEGECGDGWDASSDGTGSFAIY